MTAEAIGIAGFISAWVLGVTFLVAAIAKGHDINGFARTIERAAALFRVTLDGRGAAAAATILVALEFALAGLLLSGYERGVASLVALPVLVVFALTGHRAKQAPAPIPCNCFGRSGATLGEETVARAMVLAVSATVALISAAVKPWSPSSVDDVALTIAFVIAGILAVMWSAGLPELLRLQRDRKRLMRQGAAIASGGNGAR